MALITAMIVVLVGSLLVTAVFQVMISFHTAMQTGQMSYQDHLNVTDYIEGAKGWITQINQVDGRVRHPVGLLNNTTQVITNVNTLVFTDPALSVDETLGKQRLVMRVFDSNYRARQIDSSLRNDPDAMRMLPPPLSLLEQAANNIASMNDVGHRTDPTGYIALDEQEVFAAFFRNYGAYLIRVELFNDDGHGGEVLARRAEEAFFQFISADAK